MRLKTFMPSGIVIDEEISRFRFEAQDGSRTLLPRHVDFVTAVSAGIVSFDAESGEHKGQEVFMACDQGILVKQSSVILLSVRRVIIHKDLNVLARAIGEEFKKVEEERKSVTAAITRLEVGLTRGLMQLSSRR